jgi:Fe-Mn family superoxide dismutase
MRITMTFLKPKLPYDLGALSPFVSEEQMDYHYNKHHEAYFKNLNRLVDGKPECEMSLEDLMVKSSGGIFNNAAQAWNHTFFWECMSPFGGGSPKSSVMQAIERDFGDLDAFKKELSQKAATLFGSGWAWVAKDASGKLEILPLSNADTPIKHGKKAILTIDVWEHAYYIDYRNERPKFIEKFFDVINWDFVEKCYKS